MQLLMLLSMFLAFDGSFPFQLTPFAAIGLQFGFKTFRWISTIPPMFVVVAFKIYINRTYHPAFYYFNPTQEEINEAKIHSERADAKNNKLEKRFGHPALHTELFTPMLHKNMMPLLSEVYQGRIGSDHAKLDEYGGQSMEAQVLPGGIKIAAIDQVGFSTVYLREFPSNLLPPPAGS